MKILLYQNRKMDPRVWDASTPELEAKAMKALFKFLDKEWQCYEDLKTPITKIEQFAAETSSNPRETMDMRIQLGMREQYKQAKRGDAKAIRWLLGARRDYEYEYWSLIKVEDV